MIEDLVKRNRSYRRFHEDYRIEESTLRDLVDLARLSASAGNLQSLKYIISADPKRNGLIFPTLRWAAYFTDWPGPPEGERPTAYIVVLGDTEISRNFFCDHGIGCSARWRRASAAACSVPLTGSC